MIYGMAIGVFWNARRAVAIYVGIYDGVNVWAILRSWMVVASLFFVRQRRIHRESSVDLHGVVNYAFAAQM